MTSLDKAGLVALADRVEALTLVEALGGSLDWLIFVAAFGENDPRPQLDYTASLDAAMTLVPDSHWWNVGHNMGPNPGTRGLFRGCCYPPGQHWPPPYVIASTPALALTAAALRAIAAGRP